MAVIVPLATQKIIYRDVWMLGYRKPNPLLHVRRPALRALFVKHYFGEFQHGSGT
jgi:hypothetical protein